MPFTTLTFFTFFTVVFLAYYALPKKMQWMLLLCASLFFYAYASPFYLFLLLSVAAITYCGAVWIGKIQSRRDETLAQNKGIFSREQKKACREGAEKTSSRVVALVVLALLVILGVFKYLQFILDNVAWLGGALGWHIASPTLNIILPVGLSFYIFQGMGYCIDVHRELVLPEKNFFKHLLFVSYFPQIMQGPIGNYSRLAPQFFVEHQFDYEQAVYGLQRIAWGLFKKFMIANIIADRINPAWGNVGDYPGFVCWAAILFLYAIQLYADFSGYMDIACGCSQMLGIKLDENFNCPYFSRTVAEFWRRWHMTLGSWFKDYLFYPVLRSDSNFNLRKRLSSFGMYLSSALPTAYALSIVWLTTGLWHGASWGYVVWGIYYGVFIILGIMLEPVYERCHSNFPRLYKNKTYVLFQMARTFAIVVFGYSIFKPGDLSVTVQIFRQMFSAIDGGGIYQIQYTLHHSFIKVFGWIALMFVVDVIHYTKPKGTIRAWVHNLHWYVRWPIYIAGIWLVIFYGIYGSGFEHFEYFKF